MTNNDQVALTAEHAELVNRTVKNCTAAFDRWLDDLAERLFWEFDERHKKTGVQRDAFKAAIRETVAEHEAMLALRALAGGE